MIKVSVIVPVYNTQEYLVKCLDSLVSQTLQEIEIVIIDDGSTDHSPKIIDDYAEKYPEKIKVIRKENGGQAAARNLGIQISKGEYIGFLDSDDYADRIMFEELYTKATQDFCDLVECNYSYLDENQNQIKKYGHLRKYSSQKEMFINPLVSPWTKLYKKSILTESGILFPEGVIYEDTAFFIQLIPFIKKMEYIEKPMIYHILRTSSTMNSNRSWKIANIFHVLEKILDFYKEHHLIEEYEKELEYFCVKILLSSSLGRISQVKQKEIKKELIKGTQDFIEQHFSNYRKNTYFKKGMQNFYMKSVNRFTIHIYVWLMKTFRK